VIEDALKSCFGFHFPHYAFGERMRMRSATKNLGAMNNANADKWCVFLHVYSFRTLAAADSRSSMEKIRTQVADDV
jgi:hypothetical protein